VETTIAIRSTPATFAGSAVINTVEGTYTSVNLYDPDGEGLRAGRQYDPAKMTHAIGDAGKLLRKLAKRGYTKVGLGICPVAEAVEGPALKAEADTKADAKADKADAKGKKAKEKVEA